MFNCLTLDEIKSGAKIEANCLILGDCEEVLPFMSRVDAVVTDPPYGIGEDGEKSKRPRSTDKWKNPKPIDYGLNFWDKKPIDQSLYDKVKIMADYQIIFGGNYYCNAASSCWLVWDKMNGNNDFADCELAFTNLKKAVRKISFLWNGFQKAEKEKRGDHPTQKPVAVMRWAISHLPTCTQTVFDPFMGSGTTCVAAIEMGRKFIGIEREPKYFEIAKRRCEEAFWRMDKELKSKPGQIDLWNFQEHLK